MTPHRAEERGGASAARPDRASLVLAVELSDRASRAHTTCRTQRPKRPDARGTAEANDAHGRDPRAPRPPIGAPTSVESLGWTQPDGTTGHRPARAQIGVAVSCVCATRRVRDQHGLQ